ncbi:hypothetical protein SBA2_30009 [Acidobacteriia bacterium SbA2]|nr:hypothetical protein SBA2_30009 [Acidobacteriia bacterium SbA2]
MPVETWHGSPLPRRVYVATPQYCHSEPFAVILSPSLVILSGARNLALSIFNAVRDSSSPAASRNDRISELSHRLL